MSKHVITLFIHVRKNINVKYKQFPKAFLFKNAMQCQVTQGLHKLHKGYTRVTQVTQGLHKLHKGYTRVTQHCFD